MCLEGLNEFAGNHRIGELQKEMWTQNLRNFNGLWTKEQTGRRIIRLIDFWRRSLFLFSIYSYAFEIVWCEVTVGNRNNAFTRVVELPKVKYYMY